MIRNFLHSARLIGDGCVSFNDKCAVGLAPIEANIKKHVDNSLMLVTAFVGVLHQQTYLMLIMCLSTVAVK